MNGVSDLKWDWIVFIRSNLKELKLYWEFVAAILDWACCLSQRKSDRVSVVYLIPTSCGFGYSTDVCYTVSALFSEETVLCDDNAQTGKSE